MLLLLHYVMGIRDLTGGNITEDGSVERNYSEEKSWVNASLRTVPFVAAKTLSTDPGVRSLPIQGVYALSILLFLN